MERDLLYGDVSVEHIRREKAKARDLRRSAWWKRRCAPGICHYCGKQVGGRALTMDHVVPLARGGRSNKGNLVPACKDCNSQKKHHLAFEAWRQEENPPDSSR